VENWNLERSGEAVYFALIYWLVGLVSGKVRSRVTE
jgi:hypothetical protein